jgi:hypothetical protein
VIVCTLTQIINVISVNHEHKSELSRSAISFGATSVA